MDGDDTKEEPAYSRPEAPRGVLAGSPSADFKMADRAVAASQLPHIPNNGVQQRSLMVGVTSEDFPGKSWTDVYVHEKI